MIGRLVGLCVMEGAIVAWLATQVFGAAVASPPAVGLALRLP